MLVYKMCGMPQVGSRGDCTLHYVVYLLVVTCDCILALDLLTPCLITSAYNPRLQLHGVQARCRWRPVDRCNYCYRWNPSPCLCGHSLSLFQWHYKNMPYYFTHPVCAFKLISGHSYAKRLTWSFLFPLV